MSEFAAHDAGRWRHTGDSGDKAKAADCVALAHAEVPMCLLGHKSAFPVPTTMCSAMKWESAAAVRALCTVPALRHQPQRHRTARELPEEGEEI